MKLKHVLTAALLAMAAFFPNQSVRATLPIYNAGELFLGFRTADGSTDYLVNIGNVSQFANLSPGSTTTANTGGNIALDLSSAFDADWFTSGEVLWGIYGGTWDETTGGDNVLYATRVRSNPEVQSTPWTRKNDLTQGFSVGDLKTLAQYYTNFGEPTANSTKGTFQSAGNANSWAHYTEQNSDFRLGGSLEGATGAVLDFYRIDPATGANQPGTYLGTFTINSGGTITFTAVPEPSTVLLLGLSGLALTVFTRRRPNRNA